MTFLNGMMILQWVNLDGPGEIRRKNRRKNMATRMRTEVMIEMIFLMMKIARTLNQLQKS